MIAVLKYRMYRLWRNTRTPSSTGPCCSSVAGVSLVGSWEGGHESAGAHWINQQISNYNALWVLREALEPEVSNVLTSTGSDRALLQLQWNRSTTFRSWFHLEGIWFSYLKTPFWPVYFLGIKGTGVVFSFFGENEKKTNKKHFLFFVCSKQTNKQKTHFLVFDFCAKWKNNLFFCICLSFIPRKGTDKTYLVPL